MTTDTKAVALYPDQCPMKLDRDGEYYSRHVAAMTDEDLHRKSDIAVQLGSRDREIDTLRTALAASRAEAKGLSQSLTDCLECEKDYLSEIAELRAEVEGLKKDAERYRWLRDSAPEEWDVTRWLDNEHQEVHVQDYLDDAIDAAMEKGNV